MTAQPAGGGPLTVTVGNLHNNVTLNTGFVVGTAANASSVEVSLDGGAFAAASGTSTWSFKLPTGGSTWKVGSLHSIAVRGKDASGTPGSATTVNVRKGNNQDVNGDGYPDVAVGASALSSSAGAVYVFYGSQAGVATTNLATGGSANVTLTGAASSTFGGMVALGDVNGDGYADLAVAATTLAPGGAVYLFHSTGAAGIPSGTYASANTTLTGSSTNFGLGLAVGDVNGDGYADVAVGSPNASSNAGAAYVFYSAGAAGVPSAAYTAANRTFSGSGTSQLGYAAAIADVNGDGYGDLAVSARLETANAGAVYIYHGSATGLPASANTHIVGSGTETLGALALGDVNGDGFADLAAGAVGASANAGAVHVYLGSGTGISTTAASTLTGTSTTQFGITVALGDVNGDGYADLAVGESQANSNAGSAYVFHSAGTTGLPSVSASAANTKLNGTASGQLGYSLAIADVNGDGYGDLITGEPGALTAFVSHGSGAGIPTSAYTTLTGVASSNFGTSVAAALPGGGALPVWAGLRPAFGWRTRRRRKVRRGDSWRKNGTAATNRR